MTKRVAIIGRANTGKSSLFNALLRKKLAIVDDKPGITRDIREEWLTDEKTNKSIRLLDSGGYVETFESDIDKRIVEKVNYLIDNADVLLVVIDAKVGITKEDQNLLNMIRKRKQKDIILVANKVDNIKAETEAAELYGVGIEPVFFVSALHKRNIGELRKYLLETYGSQERNIEEEAEIPKIAIVGRSNTGKSTLINSYFGEALRVISDKPGTTRDVGMLFYNKFGFKFYLLDTAGIRKRKIMNKEDIEFYAYLRTTKAIEHSDVCILLLDAQEGITQRDLSIVRILQKERKPLIIAINKWDLVKDQRQLKAFRENLQRIFGDPLIYPVFFISAKNKNNIHKLLQATQKVLENKSKMIPTKELNDKILPILKDFLPPAHQGKSVRIKFLQQIPARVPTFLVFTNNPAKVPKSYTRFVEKQIRKHYDFSGVPIRILYKKS